MKFLVAAWAPPTRATEVGQKSLFQARPPKEGSQRAHGANSVLAWLSAGLELGETVDVEKLQKVADERAFKL